MLTILYGVGMTGCLGVGSSAAKTLAAALNKPLVGVHHMVCSPSLTLYPQNKNSPSRSSKHMP